MHVLRASKGREFCRCLAENLLTYALGRELVTADSCAVDRIVRKTEQGGFLFQALIREVVFSDLFRTKLAGAGS